MNFSKRKIFPLLQPGALVEIVSAADQSYFTTTLVGKMGVVVENVAASSSPNIWKVFIEEKMYNLHALDLKVVE